MGWRYAGKYNWASCPAPVGLCGKNRFKGPLFLCRNRAKGSPIIILSLCRLISFVLISFENFPQKKFVYKRLCMSLRELMMQRILYAVPGEELESNFDISYVEVTNLSDEDFLELFEEIFTFQG